MAYAYVSATARVRSKSAVWDAVDISAMPLHIIYSTYQTIVVTLTNPLIGGGQTKLYLDMEDARDLAGVIFNPNLTFLGWLAGLGNTALPTTTTAPVHTQSPVTFRDGWAAGYKIIPADYGRALDQELPEDDKHDLFISRPGLDPAVFYQYGLVTVNGYFHKILPDPAGIYVIGGADSWRKAKDCQIGMISFASVGDLAMYPFAPDMFFKPTANARMANYAYVNLGRSLTDKTVLLVIGGYLHVLDNVYDILDDQIIRINFNDFPFLDRVVESSRVLDLSSLNRVVSDANPMQMDISNMFSDDVLTNYLMLTQSFIVVVDTPSMYVRQHLLQDAGLPDRYLSHSYLPYLLQVGKGRVAEYLTFDDNGTWVYATADNRKQNLYFRTTNYQDFPSVDDSLVPGKPYTVSPGYLLEFGKLT